MVLAQVLGMTYVIADVNVSTVILYIASVYEKKPTQ